MIEKYALFTVFKSLRDLGTPESVNSLARKAKVGVATSKRCLDYLYAKEIVTRQVFGRMHQYRLSHESVLCSHLKICMSLEELQDSGLVAELRSSIISLTSIVLFGSAAKGTDTAQSDIDLLVISANRTKIPVLKSQKILRELSIIHVSSSEWRKKAFEDKVFYEQVVFGGIVLFGELPVVS